MNVVKVGQLSIGMDGAPPALIAGPCVIESLDLCREVAACAREVCARLGLPYIFKASFDKANRTAGASFRGRGLDAGLAVLAAIKEEYGVPVLTDVHESWQCAPVGEVCDLLQIPAFLCRQTDLLVAAAETGRAVNIKKGQFLAPWDAVNIVHKVEAAGNRNILLTERGASFGYNTLVVDYTGIPIMRDFGYPVVFDATHSVQLPGGGPGGSVSGGRRQFVPHLARAAAAVGVDALFLEIHPDPEKALSDAATMLPLRDLEALMQQVVQIDRVVKPQLLQAQ
ncbi:MAG: 3-deoxy-8-phosphooctulonate synthase [Armatimonadetes bacterium]|nr:3-deoxy-8-phosphooctulonate synthase [Armatimonadota bacterium]MDE2206348.1 3-deoxy-8-phosphooctulonate synthase [Armatimonadota bacterium]